MRIGILVSVLAVVLQAVPVRTVEPWPEWYVAQREVATMLMQGDTTLPALVQRVLETPPKNGKEAMFALFVLARAGMDGESTRFLEYLKESCASPRRDQVQGLSTGAYEKYEAWDLAQAAVEVFADQAGEHSVSWVHPGMFSHSSWLQKGLLQHFDDVGWSFEKIDKWLAARPDGKNFFWPRERLRYHVRNDLGRELAQQLAERVRAHPEDVAACVGFLAALVDVRDKLEEGPDLDWIAESIQPKTMTHTIGLASHLAALKRWEAAAVFCRKAMTMPAPDRELHSLHLSQIMRTDAAVRARHQIHIREKLARCLRELGQIAEAEKWKAEATEIQDKIRKTDQFVRGVPGGVGTQQAAADDSCRHWQEQADQHRRNRETDLEEKALAKAWSLAPPSPMGEPGKGMDRRGRALSSYAMFLHRQRRDDEAVALLRKELAESPADSVACASAVWLLAHTFRNHIEIDDAVLWTWLEKRTKWNHTVRRLLLALLRAANDGDVDTYLDRAEKLARGADPTRAYALGVVETELLFRSRAIPLFIDAMDRAQNDYLRHWARDALLPLYVNMGDWQKAEQLFVATSSRMLTGRISKQYAEIAVAAAKAGAKADAMRIWKRVANIDPTETDTLQQLADAGLRDELITFYRDMQTQLPRSRIPGQVLAQLAVRTAE